MYHVFVSDYHTVLTVSFTEPNYIVSEDAGSVMFCLTSTGDLAIGPSPPITVNVASQAVTAQGIYIECMDGVSKILPLPW